jgi:hypothetical protein
MKYGFVLPYGDARTAADLAYAAEAAGWDGFFVWEPVWGHDAWVLLTAAAMRTERIGWAQCSPLCHECDPGNLPARQQPSTIFPMGALFSP